MGGERKGREGREGTGIKEVEGGLCGKGVERGGEEGKGRRKGEGKDREGECYNWH